MGPVSTDILFGWAGVLMVSPRLLGRRLGGVRGLTKTGEGGAEKVESAFETVVIAAVVTARLSKCEFEVLTARFLRLRSFFDGVIGRCSSNTGAEPRLDGMLLLLSSNEHDDDDDVPLSLDSGDSGEVPGEGSVITDESVVEKVVVGDESVESEAEVETLPRY